VRTAAEEPPVLAPCPRMLRLERHALGPRVYVLRRRIHEYHLGLAILALLGAGAALHWVRLDVATVLAAAAGVWLVAKDWRDLTPSQRDTTAWRVGLHRRPTPLRVLRRSDFLPPVAAFAALTAGLINFVSALTPSFDWRRRILLAIEPDEAVRVSHALAVAAAAVLIVTAFYLYRRRRGALHVAIGLLVVLGALNLVKGLDFEEAAGSFAAAALLWWGRDAFHVRHDPVSLRSALWRVPIVLGGTAALMISSVWIAAPAGASLGTVLRTAGDLVLWQPAPFAFHDEVGRLPLAVALLGVTALVTIAYLIFRPLAAPRSLPDAKVRAVAVDLVCAYGSDTLAYFKLRRDKHYLFSVDGRAFLGYRIENGVMLCSGDPVGDEASLPNVIRDAVGFAERHGLKLAALGVGEALVPLWEQAGLRSFYIGDEAIVETARFSLEGRSIRKVRQSVSRLEKAGYQTELRELGTLDERTLAELEAVSDRWRSGAPERGFAMAMDSVRADRGGDSVVVITRDAAGVIRGFLHLVPTYGRSAMSLSFMRRDHDTPNGLTEFLVARGVELLRERGIDEVSLNFAAFARVMHNPACRLERVLGRVVALANPFFQIESLYRFNAKFFPRWESRYLLYEGALGLPRAALAVMWAEGQLPKPRGRRKRAAAAVR
jgi:lysyl-tRNA synthetase, class II